MLRIISETGTRGLYAAALLAVTACHGAALQDAPPPPMASADASSQSPALLGGPQNGGSTTAASVAAPDAPPPVANPEDMSPAERARVFGHRYHYTDGKRPHAVLSAMTLAPISEQITPVAPPFSVAAPQPATATAAASKPFGFPLLNLEKWLRTILSRAGAALRSGSGAAHDRLTIPSMQDIDIPGLGKVPSRSVVVSGLLILVMILLAVAARISNGRREAQERRRKFRTMTGRHDPMLEPEMIDWPPPARSAPAFKDAADTPGAPAKPALEDA